MARDTPRHRQDGEALAVAIDPRATPRKACQFCVFASIETTKDARYLHDFIVSHDCAASREPFRLQHGMTPQRICTIFRLF